MPDLSGQSIGRYHIIEKLGEGGMAIVYKAYDTHLECEVAVKVIRTENILPSSLGKTLKRFEREAKTLAMLTHPNIVGIIDYGEHDGAPYLVMPFIPGGTLKQFLKTPTPYDKAAALLIPVALALEYAHKHNIVHRDVKPSNILITESGEPMLTDFGVAKILDVEDGQTLTNTGMGIGTPEYMAPEQWIEKITPAVDVYALGVVFYELITGHKPYSADTPAAVLIKSVNDPLPRPSSFVTNIPKQVERIVFKALAKKPEDRYQSMDSMATALRSIYSREEKPSVEKNRAESYGKFLSVDNDADATTELQEHRVQRKKIPGNAGEQSIKASTKKSINRWGIGLVVCVLFAAIVYGFIQEFHIGSQHPEYNQISNSTSTAIALLIPTTTIINEPTQSRSIITPENAALLSQVDRLGKGVISQVAFSPDGSILAVATSIGIYFYDSNDFTEIRYINTDSWVRSISFSPDSSKLAAGLEKNSTEIWEVKTGELILTHEAPEPVEVVAFSPDGKLIASGSSDGSISLWDSDSGQELSNINGLKWPAECLAFSPDGTLLASGANDYKVKIWRVSDGELIQTLVGHTNNVPSVIFASDQTTIVSGSWDGTIKVWDIESGKQLVSINTLNGSVHDIVLSPDGSQIISTEYGGRIFFWQTDSGELVRSIPTIISWANTISLTPDGTKVVTANESNIGVWQISDGKKLYELNGFTSPIYSISYSPDGSLLSSGSNDGILRAWSPIDGTLKNLIDTQGNQITSISYFPNGDELASASYDGFIKVWQVSNNQLQDTFIGHSYGVRGLAISSSTEPLLAATYGYSIKFWGLMDNQKQLTLNGHSDWVNSVAFSPDENLLVSASDDHTIKIWQVSDGQLLNSLAGHSEHVNTAIFSPDGSLIASASNDYSIIMWDALNGQKEMTLQGNFGVYSLAFSPDGSILAAGTWDGINIWRVIDGQLLATLSGQSNNITSVAFSPDGYTLASGATDGTILLWEVPPISE